MILFFNLMAYKMTIRQKRVTSLKLKLPAAHCLILHTSICESFEGVFMGPSL
jgi:hypothetical protein